MMQSPHAVYRSELGDGKGSYAAGQTYPLTQYQIASELAYTFGGSTPSADLLAKADQGELSTADALVIEARKLQLTDRGQEVIREFFREWLSYRTVVDKVKTTNKDFDLVKGPMAEETRRFLDQVILTKNGGVRDLLLAPYTVVNSGLATFYGIGGSRARSTIKWSTARPTWESGSSRKDRSWRATRRPIAHRRPSADS